MRLLVPVRLVILGVLASCTYGLGRLPRPAPRPAVPLTPPVHLCVSDVPRRPCREADEIERWLARPDLELLGAAEPPAGIQGPRVLTLRVPGPAPVVFRAKWRAHATAIDETAGRIVAGVLCRGEVPAAINLDLLRLADGQDVSFQGKPTSSPAIVTHVLGINRHQVPDP